jgi:hypothetical protein
MNDGTVNNVLLRLLQLNILRIHVATTEIAI